MAAISTTTRLARGASEEHLAQISKVFTSASRIASVRPDEIVSAVPSISLAAATAIHANAKKVTARNELVAASAAAQATALSNGRFPLFESVNLEELFGESVFSECEECNSVLSPAAYLVDLLHSLPPNARDELKARRSDIWDIGLSCENTNTEIPLIDLANEVLEAYLSSVLPGSDPAPTTDDGVDEDTTPGATADQQHVNKKVYNYLRSQVVPIGKLPYDRDLDQVRGLLKNSSVTREELLQAFSATSGCSDVDKLAYERAVTCERLQIADAEYAALTHVVLPTGKAPSDYWGFPSADAMTNDFSGLSRVDEQFLPKTDYSLEEISQLLRARFVNPAGLDAPNALRETSLSIGDIWSLVDWHNDESTRWTRLFSVLKIDSSKSPQVAARIKDAVLKLPDSLCLTFMQRQVANHCPNMAETERFYSMSGWVEWGQADAVAVGDAIYLCPRGMAYPAVEGAHWPPPPSPQIKFYFDENGVARLMESGSLDDPPLYDMMEGKEDFFLWIRRTNKASPRVARLLRDNKTWEPVGEKSYDDYAPGPTAASKSAGWAWKQQNPDEEPGGALPKSLTIRTRCGLPLTVESWDKMNTFVRLQKALGWTIKEVDDALLSLQATATTTYDTASFVITSTVLDNLASIKILRDSTGLTITQLSPLWAGFDRPAYEALFLLPAVLRIDSSFGLDKDEKPIFLSATDTIADHVHGIAVAFNTTTTALTAFLDQGKLKDKTMDLDSLKLLYRQFLVCGLLGQSSGSYDSLLKLSPPDAFQDPKSVLANMQFWGRTLRSAPASPSDWEFILTGKDQAGSRQNLEALLPAAFAIYTQLSQEAMALALLSPPSDPPAASKNQNSSDKVASSAVVVTPGATSSGNWKGALIALFPDIPADICELILTNSELEETAEADFTDFEGYLIPKKTGVYSISSTSSSGADPKALFAPNIQLVGGKFYRIKGTSLTWKDPSGTTSFISKECLLPYGFLYDIQKSYNLLARHQALFSSLSVSKDDMEAFLGLAKLTVPDSKSATSDYQLEIQRLLDTQACRSFFASAQSLAEVLHHPGFDDPSAAAQFLAQLTSGDQTMLKTLIGRFTTKETPGFTFTLGLLVRIQAAQKICNKLGVTDPSIVFAWAQSAPDTEALLAMAGQLRNVIQSRVGDEVWNNTASALFDPVRRASRNALIAACLVMIPELIDSDSLFEYFLIDVNMGTCLQTSRMKQAISSVQTFYQRCLLGLEANVQGSEFTEDDRAAWEWKKSIGTWQANRKVLLFPENWMDPTLRDSKTPEFRDLESTLSQGQFDAKAAFSKYIADTALIANLEPIATYEGTSRDFVFARTRQAPHVFYYRYVDLDTLCWTPWAKVDVEIPTVQLLRTYGQDTSGYNTGYGVVFRRDELVNSEGGPKRNEVIAQFLRDFPERPICSGSYVYPFAFSGEDERLLLFVPTITERTMMVDTDLKRCGIEISLAVSELRDGKWQPKQTSAATILAVSREDEEVEEGPEYMRMTWADPDENKRRMGIFGCHPYQVDDHTVGIKVYPGQVYYNPNWEDTDTTIGRVVGMYAGEFVFQSGHLSVGGLREKKPDERHAAGHSDANLLTQEDAEDAGEEICFGGKHYTFGGSEKYTNRHLVTAKNLYTRAGGGWPAPCTIDFLHDPTMVMEKGHPVEPSRQAVFQRRGQIMPLSLRQCSATDFQLAMATDSYDKLFDYFNQDTWELAYHGEDNGKLDKDPTDAMHQGLGKPMADSPLYHELYTPAAIYNWEVCVHLPMLLASHFFQVQLFDEALDMIRRVLDLRHPDKKQVWRFRPFREEASKSPAEHASGITDEIVEEWSRNPFDPFTVARFRPSAYMKWFAGKHIEIVVAKGDAAFRKFTMESVNEAVQCYVEASHLFGRKPQVVQPAKKRPIQTYHELVEGETPSLLLHVEANYPYPLSQSIVGSAGTSVTSIDLFGPGAGTYFCLPSNSALAQLRDLIDDRLYKIHNCMDIDGNPRKLALWEPPLDPGALVSAAGVANLGSMLDGPTLVAPNYRFDHMLRFALELSSELRSLAGVLLSVRERKDAELLAGLRLQQESAIGMLIRDAKQAQIDEARLTQNVLRSNREAAVSRLGFYLSLLGRDNSDVLTLGEEFQKLEPFLSKPILLGPFAVSPFEAAETALSLGGLVVSAFVPLLFGAAALAALIPQFETDMSPMGVGENVEYGGAQISASISFGATAVQSAADLLRQGADNAGRFAALQRQMQERTQAANQAGYEIASIDAQIAAQELRVTQAVKDLEIQTKALENLAETEAFYKTKYTRAELYEWMAGSLQHLYYQAYNLAYSAAAQAEMAFRYERGPVEGRADFPSAYIQPTYWNSTRDGLLAGEQLALDLRRLEQAHTRARAHDFEITKHVSLRQISPRALALLRKDGATGEFRLPEVLFDLDFPGHYRRRIKSVSVSIPCVVGPYTSLNCTLELLQSKYRVVAGKETELSYPAKSDDDDRFRTDTPASSVAAVSTAQSDAGVFELNFHDERYMPFEGAGVISKWKLELSSVARQFSYSTISDVVLHISYTSCNAVSSLQDAASKYAKRWLTDASNQDGLCFYADVRAEFATAWAAFRATGNLVLERLDERLPFFARGGSVKIQKVALVVQCTSGTSGATAGTTLRLTTSGEKSGIKLLLVPEPGDTVVAAGKDLSLFFTEPVAVQDSWSVDEPAGNWVFTFAEDNNKKNPVSLAQGVGSMHLLVTYTLII
ncbi:hypothetical protein GQ53DRAFT_841289 [Thozetella sp. PMI_491]|nr:hypothetical protein GQ53DRAFT_841289 [Thozetella sp. PMI_491]